MLSEYKDQSTFFLVKNGVVPLASIRWNVFMTVFDNSIGQKLLGSSVLPFLCMILMILSPHWAGTALVARTFLKSVAITWCVFGR